MTAYSSSRQHVLVPDDDDNDEELSDALSSTVSTSSLLDTDEPQQRMDDVTWNNNSNDDDDDDDLVVLSRQQTLEKDSDDQARYRQKQQERERRRTALLTNLTLEEITIVNRDGLPAYFQAGAVQVIRGSCSQFDVNRRKGLLPPLTSDCCQTFSTVSAIIFSSFGYLSMLETILKTSAVNYMMYISAWMHQLTAPTWPGQQMRPTINDLNTSLRLHHFFPAKIHGSEFLVLFYDQADRVRKLVEALCVKPSQPPEAPDGPAPICGYVIVSGDYTVSIFSLPHDENRAGRPQAWTLFISDSHGTFPWALGKAALSSVTLTSERRRVTGSSKLPILPMGEGITHFLNILFALLEDHRKMRRLTTGDPSSSSSSSAAVPYMTWTPIHRAVGTRCSAMDLKQVIDNQWVPFVLANPLVEAERAKFGPEHPRACFWFHDPAVKGVVPTRQSTLSFPAAATPLGPPPPPPPSEPKVVVTPAPHVVSEQQTVTLPFRKSQRTLDSYGRQQSSSQSDRLETPLDIPVGLIPRKRQRD